MGDEGWSAEQRAEDLRARGKRSAGAWAAGAEGERRVAAALASLPSGWLVLHDRLLMPGLAESNIDHLLVGPAGVVLVDAKNWAGHISEWNGAVYQHSTTATGFRQHRALDREFAGVRRMATEVARRTGTTVLAVICLAGRQAADFGEPRLVHGVWVVPVHRLPGWLAARPSAVIPDRQRLDVLARTEFPATTTHPALLEAIGRQLRATAPQPTRGPGRTGRTRQSRARTTARTSRPGPRPARRPASAPTTRTAGPVRARAPRSRSTGTSRAGDLMRLVGIVLLLAGTYVGLESGAIPAAGEAFGTYVGQRAAEVAGAGTGQQGSATARPATTDGRFVCDDFVPSAATGFDGPTLTARPTTTGCEWTVPARNATTAPVVVLQVIEFTSNPALNPLIARSAETRAPVVSKAWPRGHWSAYAWVAEGIRVRVGADARTTTRNVCVVVGYETLGKTERQGRTLAVLTANTIATEAVPSPA